MECYWYKLRKFCGQVANRVGMKGKLITFYEKSYEHVKTVQMYLLLPFDKNYRKKNQLKIMTIEETLNYIIENNCSVSRYGDGEFNLLSSSSIGFQESDFELVNRLQKIVRKTGKSNCLICLPGMFAYENEYEKATRRYFEKILVHKRKEWYSYCSRQYFYGNADITRCYVEFSDKSKTAHYFLLLKQIWNKRKVIIIEGEKTRLGVGNDLFNNVAEIKRVLCPVINAFKVYDEILGYVTKFVTEDVLILIALGPTATVMAADLSERGYQAIDIGNIDKEYEWWKAKSLSKMRNPLKFSMEVKGGTVVEECTDQYYLDEIIWRIGC